MDKNKDNNINIYEFRNAFEITEEEKYKERLFKLEWAAPIFSQIRQQLQKKGLAENNFFENPSGLANLSIVKFRKGLALLKLPVIDNDPLQRTRLEQEL